MDVEALADIRRKVETADDALTQALDQAEMLEATTDATLHNQAVSAAKLTDTLSGKCKAVSDRLRERVTPPVKGGAALPTVSNPDPVRGPDGRTLEEHERGL